jgi:opacity protein-like surface antigen
MLIMLKQLSIVALALLATHATAATANQPFVTLGIGQSSYSDVCKDLQDVDTCDDKDTAFRIGAGIELSPMYAVELTYLNHGEGTVKYSDSDGFGHGSLEAETFAVQMSANATVAPQFNIYGKAGIALTTSKATDTYNFIGVGQFTDSTKDDSTNLIVTIGAQYELMPNLMADVQFDYLPNAIDLKDFEFESDISTFSLGLKYQF